MKKRVRYSIKKTLLNNKRIRLGIWLTITLDTIMNIIKIFILKKLYLMKIKMLEVMIERKSRKSEKRPRKSFITKIIRDDLYS